MGKDYFHKALDIIIDHPIEKNKNFYIRPHTIFTYDLKENKTSFDEENIGFDFSFNPSFSTKFKLSFFPDYSDVPMDNVKDIYNSKYPPSYNENRYFFIEDFNVLGVDDNLFHSRYIIQPIYALKFTSNAENYSFGLLSSLDKETEGASDDMFNIIAFKPVYKQFRLQTTLLNRMNLDGNYHNEVLHLEPTWEFNRNHFIWIDMNLSYIDSLDSTDYPKKGYYGKIGYNRRNKDFYFSISAQQMQKDYAVDMGEIYEDDFYGWNINTYYSKDINDDILRELNTTINLSEEIDNQTDILLERYSYLNVELETNYNLEFDFDYVHVKEYYNSKYFGKTRTGFRFTWDKISWFEQHVGINLFRYLVYELSDMHDGIYLQYSLSGVLDKYVSYTFSVDYLKYSDLPECVFVDDEYCLGNFDITLNLSNKLSLTNGLRYDNNDSYHKVNNVWGFYSEFIGFFSNFSWEFKRDCYVYLGYKTLINKIDNSYQEDYQKLYTKISYNF
jgi:hypothetical protein